MRKTTTYFAAPVFVYNRVSLPYSNKSTIRYLEVFWLSIQSFGTPSPVWIIEPMHISFSPTYFWILVIFLGIIGLCGINKWPNMTPQISRNLIKDWYHGMYSLLNISCTRLSSAWHFWTYTKYHLKVVNFCKSLLDIPLHFLLLVWRMSWNTKKFKQSKIYFDLLKTKYFYLRV